jgi:hypothetical protein
VDGRLRGHDDKGWAGGIVPKVSAPGSVRNDCWTVLTVMIGKGSNHRTFQRHGRRGAIHDNSSLNYRSGLRR